MKYTAIYDVSKAITDILRDSVVPEIIAKPEEVGLCSPANHGDYVMGIYLYNIEQSESFRLSGKQNEGLYTQKHPPMVLDLFYMITPYFKTDVKFLAEQEQLLFGKTVQTINDNPVILTETTEPIEFELIYPLADDKQKIWNADEHYRTSVFAKAKAVVIESLRVEKVSRVTDIRIVTDITNTRRG